MTIDRGAAQRAIDLFVGRGQLDRVDAATPEAARTCLDRARKRMSAVVVLIEAEHWESAFTTAYDAYRTSADAVVLLMGYRVPAVKGAHRIATDVAHAALKHDTDVFGPVSSDRFRSGRHESEYFDPDKPVEKSEGDARWAASLASTALVAVAAAVD
ncbi:MAG: hypothetical protein KDB21_16765 [Acidimicrobiales bacterium]|nr:hypothetical protein [Acidimicrobiales bacterium]